METKSLQEILDLISENYEQKKLSKEDLTQISLSCLMLSKVQKHDEINEFKKQLGYMKKYGDDELLELIPDGKYRDSRDLFKNNLTLSKYHQIKSLSKEEIDRNLQDDRLKIYFSDNSNKLEPRFDEDPNFASSQMKKDFDHFRSKNGNYACPDYVIIPKADLDDIINGSATGFLEPAISINEDDEINGRVTVVLTTYRPGTTLHYDTFSLYPPRTQ